MKDSGETVGGISENQIDTKAQRYTTIAEIRPK